MGPLGAILAAMSGCDRGGCLSKGEGSRRLFYAAPVLVVMAFIPNASRANLRRVIEASLACRSFSFFDKGSRDNPTGRARGRCPTPPQHRYKRLARSGKVGDGLRS